jgi:hypothetical protein
MKAVEPVKSNRKVKSDDNRLSLYGRKKTGKKTKGELIKETEEILKRKKELDMTKSPEVSLTEKKIASEESGEEVITNEDEQFQITNSGKSYRLGEEQNLIKRIRVGSLF